MKTNSKNLIRVDPEFYDYLQKKRERINQKNPYYPIKISTPNLTKMIVRQLKEMDADRQKDKKRMTMEMDFLKW